MRRDRRGFRAERLPEFRRIDFVEPDAERRTVEGVEDRHGIAVRNPHDFSPDFGGKDSKREYAEQKRQQFFHRASSRRRKCTAAKKGGAPPYTTADAYHCVTNNARKVHRLPKGKRYTIQLSVIRIKSKRLRVVFSAVF